MQLVEQTLATTTKELTNLQQWCILNDIEGDINLTFKTDGKVEVWQPEKIHIASSIAPKHVALERFPVSDEHPEEPDSAHEFIEIKGTESCH